MTKTIMIVDDSATMRQMVKFTLEGVGYQVVEAKDGVDALAKLSAQKLDLFITDLNMPNMDGIQLTRQLRAAAPYRVHPDCHADDRVPAREENGGKGGWRHRLDYQTV